MPIPDLEPNDYLPPGLHAASFKEVAARFGVGSPARERQIELLRQVVEAAKAYPTIKRVLVWGSFVTSKPEPNDLDYSIVISVDHRKTQIALEHRRFLVPVYARQYYGVDRNYLEVPDYPFDVYIEKLDFIGQDREDVLRGIVEINLRGEFTGEE